MTQTVNLNAEAGGGVAVKAEPDMHSQPQDLDIRATVLLLYPTEHWGHRSEQESEARNVVTVDGVGVCVAHPKHNPLRPLKPEYTLNPKSKKPIAL